MNVDYTEERKQLACMLMSYVVITYYEKYNGKQLNYDLDSFPMFSDCINAANEHEFIMQDDGYIDTEKTREWAEKWADEQLQYLMIPISENKIGL